MTKILLTLVTISVWILFVVGCLALLGGIVGLFLFPAGRGMNAAFGFGAFSIMLSVIATWFRQQLL
jgi:hypothetical protein